MTDEYRAIFDRSLTMLTPPAHRTIDLLSAYMKKTYGAGWSYVRVVPLESLLPPPREGEAEASGFCYLFKRTGAEAGLGAKRAPTKPATKRKRSR